jgi:hypothetical protein
MLSLSTPWRYLREWLYSSTHSSSRYYMADCGYFTHRLYCLLSKDTPLVVEQEIVLAPDSVWRDLQNRNVPCCCQESNHDSRLSIPWTSHYSNRLQYPDSYVAGGRGDRIENGFTSMRFEGLCAIIWHRIRNGGGWRGFLWTRKLTFSFHTMQKEKKLSSRETFDLIKKNFARLNS